MKLLRNIVYAVLCLAFSACQTPLYRAVESKNTMAVKKELSAGANLYETRGVDNLYWKIPTLPIALAADFAEIAACYTVIGALPLLFFYDNGREIIEFRLTEWVAKYGTKTAAEASTSSSREVRRALADYGNSPRYVREYGKTLLHDALVTQDGDFRDKLLNMAVMPDVSHLKVAIDANDYTSISKIQAYGVMPTREMMAQVIQSGNTVKMDCLLTGGAKPDSTHLQTVLDANDYTSAQKFLKHGAAPTNDMLIKAIQSGDATKARFLVRAGMNVNSPLHENSYQFIAQEAGQLALYRSLGGKVVAQPEAPPVDCPSCKEGLVPNGTRRCGSCGGTGSHSYSTTSYVQRGYAGCDPNDPNNRGYETVTNWHTTTCGSCSGSGRVTDYTKCLRCNGRGLISRYAL